LWRAPALLHLPCPASGDGWVDPPFFDGLYPVFDVFEGGAFEDFFWFRQYCEDPQMKIFDLTKFFLVKFIPDILFK
jgi:hypothetical protein